MFCQYSVRKKKMPNMPKLISPATVEPAAKVGLRKKCSGSMGLSVWASTQRKAAWAMTPTAKSVRMKGEVQP